MQELLRRRLPQTALAFVIAGWGLVQFVQFLEERYALSPRWVEMLGITWLLVLPSVLFLGWTHGAPDRQAWTRRHSAFVGTNSIVLLAVLGLWFRGAGPAGATVTTVTVEDEHGMAVERKVAARDYRHVVQLSFPSTDTLEEAEKWRGPGLAYLLEQDLFQNPFVEIRSPWETETVVQRAGITDPRQLPRALVREVAQRNRADFYVLGSLEHDGPDNLLRVQLVRTQQGEEQARATFRNADLFALTDEVTVWMREAMGLPRADGEDFPDLPVAEVVTQNPEALRPLVDGMGALLFDRDFESAQEQLEAAVSADPTCAMGQMMLYSTLVSLNRFDEAQGPIGLAMQHAYRLSERMQFVVRAQYYGAQNDVQKALAVMEMWRQVIPGDTVVYRLLAANYNVLGQPRRALAALDGLLGILPEDAPALTLRADLMQRLGDPAGAQETLERLLELQPKESRHHLGLANALRDQGELEAARASALQAQLLDPTDFDANLFLADLDARQGRPREADRAVRAAMESAVSDQDRLNALEQLIGLERRRARFTSALALVDTWESLASRIIPPAQLIIHRARWEEIRAETGRIEDAWARLAELREKTGQPLDRFVALGSAMVAIEEENPERAREAVDELAGAVEELRVGLLRPIVAALDAEARYLAGEYEASIAACDSALAGQADLRRALLLRARSERALGRTDAAVRTITTYLESDPASPTGNLELARSLLDSQRPDLALAHLETAVSMWEDAEVETSAVRDARTLLDAARKSP